MPICQIPGVYVQEIATAAPTISPSPTSRALFMGRATMGPVEVPVMVNSVPDFRANFGTGAAGSALEREVELLFGNDGKELIMVRVFGPDPHSSAPSKAAIDLGAFTLEAASESLWGRSMIVSVALPRGSRPLRKQERREGEAFNLEVRVSGTGTSVPAEVQRELTLGDGPRRVDRVLEEGSRFVRFRKRGEGRSMSKGRFLAVGGSDNLPFDASSMIGSDGGGMNALDRAEGFDVLYIPLTGTIRSWGRRFLQPPRTVAGPTGPYSCWTGLGDGPPSMMRGTAFRRSGRPWVMRPRTQPCTSLALRSPVAMDTKT